MEQITIRLTRDTRPRIDPEHNLTKIKEFASTLPQKSMWMKQALRSLITEDTHGGYASLRESAISNISLGSEDITVEFEEYMPKYALYAHKSNFANIGPRPTGEYYLEERSHKILLDKLKDYTYEANGLVKPDPDDPIASKYPKYDLIRQLVDQERRGVIQKKDKRIIAEHAWGMGPIDEILIMGKKQGITLESLTLDEVPLNAVETKMREYADRIENYRKEIGKRTTKIFRATERKTKDGTYTTYDNLWDICLSYITPKRRRLRKLKGIRDEEDYLTIPIEEQFEIGLTRLDTTYLSKLTLLHIEHALADQIFQVKMEASVVHYFNTKQIDELFERTDQHIKRLDWGIKQYLPE